ncbi:MAG: imidazole glycerol phosphate synthase subunit HisF, partial [Firmicutes bacterium]|nr:imidazole glycerol phosphate synthase subunit HisF [Bacillota bacterium]
GGAGCAEHFYDVLTQGHADAALAASVFHFSETSIGQVKAYLKRKGVPVR